jgi:hypothetical protein
VFVKGHKLTILKPQYMDAGIEHISKWLADGGSQSFHCQRRRLQLSKGRHLNEVCGPGLELDKNMKSHLA